MRSTWGISWRQEDKQGTERKTGKGIGMNHCLGLIMRKSWILLILTFVFMSSSAQATLANCPACMGEQPDWAQSATAFLEGTPMQDTPSTLSGPEQARLLNAQIDARKKASQASNTAGNTTVKPMHSSTALFDIDLFDIRAVPNPAYFNDEVKIIAVFGNASSNLTTPDNPSKIIDLTHLTIYADIRNSAGLDVGKVNLRPSSENGYSGIWNASVESDIYNATIEASGPDGSKTFNDALQIAVIR
jgi:hypothetical protein